MKKINSLLILLLISVFFSCNSDDNSSTNLKESRDEITIVLTSSGASKTWRISQAFLINGNLEIDISQNFNIVDDEFIFGGTTENITLKWQKGYDIQTDASNSLETLLDNYVSSIITSFGYQDGSSTVIEADFGRYIFQINENNTINATIMNDDNTVFNFTLVEKKQADYAIAPQTGLNFTTAFTFESNSISLSAPRMIGSYLENSFFIATRELFSNNGPAERVLKFDISTNNITENVFFYQPQLISKQIHIFDNQLIVIAAQEINIYNLNISGDPVSLNHGKKLSRFGTAVLNNDIYIIGGDLDDVEGNKVFKWNLDSQTLTEFSILPEPKSGARATIVNDNMYIFGGSETLFGVAPTSTIYKININNPSVIETFQMNKVMDFTYVQKFQNLIYLAGKIRIRDGNGTIIGRESTIGVFNTLDNTYQELTSNLTNPSSFDSIHQMCIFNDKMYIIYGNQGIDNGGQFNEWEVLVSDLN